MLYIFFGIFFFLELMKQTSKFKSSLKTSKYVPSYLFHMLNSFYFSECNYSFYLS